MISAFLIGVFNSFTLNVIIDLIELKSTVLLFHIYFPFFLFFNFLPSFLAFFEFLKIFSILFYLIYSFNLISLLKWLL